MKKIFNIFLTLAVATGLASCSDNWTPGSDKEDGEGRVSLTSMGVEVSSAESVVSRASVDLSDFIVTITSDADGSVAATWTYKNMPELFALPVGLYTVTVESGKVQKAAWDAPYYKGSKQFQINNGEITNVGVVNCAFSNIRVSILFADELKPLLGDDVKVTVVCNDEGSLVFTPTETRSGYFEAIPGSSTLAATFEGTLKGETAPIVLSKTYSEAKAGEHYKVTFKVRRPNPDIPDETGTIKLKNGLVLSYDIVPVGIAGDITVDGEDVIPGTRPTEGGDEPDPGPGGDPAQETITFECSPSLSFTSPIDPNDPGVAAEALVKIHADNGVAHLMVHIESNSDAFIASAGEMVPFDFDLAYPTVDGVDWSDKLGPAGLNFPVGSDVIGKTDIDFNITDFAFLLGAFPGTHTFRITVTDGNNIQSSRTLIFVAQ